MIPVIKTQWRKDKRNPWVILGLIAASILMTILFSGGNHETTTTAAFFSTEEQASEIEEKWEALLNNHDTITFVHADEASAYQDIEEGNRSVAIQLMEHDYRLIAANDTQTVQLVQSHVQSVFTEEAQIVSLAQLHGVDPTDIRDEMNRFLDNPPLQSTSEAVDGGEVSSYKMSIQLLFGFTLFMAMFIIGFKVNAVSGDKVSGIWDRMILSPVSKTGMYTGHLLYSFTVGFLQIAIVFVIFQFVMGYDLGDNFVMLLTIAAVFSLSMVSLAMLFTGIVRTPEHFYMVYPSIIPIIPLISGAYMPPGIISNPVLVFIADLFPLKHAMNALTNVAFYDAGWGDIALPIVLMLLIGVICMGVGVNLVERRSS